MRRWPWLFTCAILGCFGEPDTDGANDDDDDDTGSEAGTTLATTGPTSSGPGATTAGSGSVEGSGTDPADGTDTETDTSGSSGDADGSSTDATATSSDEAESSSTGEPETWCDTQPSSVLLCYDFDGPLPFLGATVYENNGTVEVSDDHAVSAPQSMRAEVEPTTDEVSNATFNRTVAGATLPFDGVLATRVWVDPSCHAELGGTIERFMLAIAFHDGMGSNLLNITVWFNADYLRVYESTNPMGYPSTPHQLAIAVPTATWVDVALAYDASGTVVTFEHAGVSYPVQLELTSGSVIGALAGVTPGVVIGATMNANQPGCTMYFDNLTVSE